MKALLLGYYGSKNLGDDMMLSCLLDSLKAQKAEVTVISEHPEETRSRFDVRVIQNTSLTGKWHFPFNWLEGLPFRLIWEMWKSDALIMGGGDLIRDDKGPWIFFFNVEKILLAFLLRRPVHLVGMGIGRPSTWYGRLFLRFILPRCKTLLVRDGRSEKLCRELAPSVPCILSPDIVMYLPQVVSGSTKPAFRSTAPSQSDYAVVSLRDNANTYGRYPFESAHIKGLAACLDHLIERQGLRVVFLPFQSGDDMDDRLHQQVVSAMKHADRTIMKPWTSDFSEIMECVAGARFVMGMRLHAAILALTLQRPCILMPYDHKMDELKKRFDIGFSIQSKGLEEPEVLMKNLEDFAQNADSHVSNITIPEWESSPYRRFLFPL